MQGRDGDAKRPASGWEALWRSASTAVDQMESPRERPEKAAVCRRSWPLLGDEVEARAPAHPGGCCYHSCGLMGVVSVFTAKPAQGYP